MEDIDLEKASNEMILSISGWRGLFNIENSEESDKKELNISYSILTGIATNIFADFLSSKNIQKIILARDGRPTGENIEKIVFLTLKNASSNFEIITLGIAPIPETISFARDENAAFFYISASHNPIGYNGFKFGFGNEGVLPSSEAKTLIQNFKNAIKTSPVSLYSDIIDKAKTIKNIENLEYKKTALSSYQNNTIKVVSLTSSKEESISCLEVCKKEASELQKRTPIYIVCDFNGSARASI